MNMVCIGPILIGHASSSLFQAYRTPCCHGLPGLARDLSLSSDEIVPVEGQEKAKPLKKPNDNSCAMTSACKSSYMSQHIFFCQRFMIPAIFIGHVEEVNHLAP
jgi:hypothetical protein